VLGGNGSIRFGCSGSSKSGAFSPTNTGTKVPLTLSVLKLNLDLLEHRPICG